MIHLCEKNYVLVQAETVFLLSIDHGTHEIHVRQLMDVVSISPVFTL